MPPAPWPFRSRYRCRSLHSLVIRQRRNVTAALATLLGRVHGLVGPGNQALGALRRGKTGKDNADGEPERETRRPVFPVQFAGRLVQAGGNRFSAFAAGLLEPDQKFVAADTRRTVDRKAAGREKVVQTGEISVG